MRYLDEVRFEVKAENHDEFIEIFKKFKKILIENNSLPSTFNLYKDIENSKNTFTFFMEFKTEEEYDNWDEKVKKIPNLQEIWEQNKKYFVSYNWSEKINL